MQGKKKEEISPKWILSRISEWQIYKRYVPKFVTLNRKILSPFRIEKTPSFLVFNTNGRIYFQDFGDPKLHGGVFDLVGLLYDLTYPEALKRIAQDFGLTESSGVEGQKVVWEQPEIVEIPTVIQIESWPSWKPYHLEWLQSYSLTSGDTIFCSDTKVYPVKKWAVNGLRMPLEKDEICLAYNLVNERGNWLKIYRPNKGKKEKWRSNIPLEEIMGLSCLKKCNTLIISKSLKEALILKKHMGLNVIVVQSENICCFTQSNIDRINSLCSEIYVSFDSDEPGKKASWELTKLTGWKHINVPNKWLSIGVKDWGDMVYEYGVEPMIAHFKKKHII